MVLNIVLALIVLVACFLIYVAFQPADFFIERKTTVAASPETIFPHINHAKKMDAWNPWSKMDPTVKMEFSGPLEGVGSVSSWKGAKKMGTGSATVIESVPVKYVRTKLAYTEPMVATQDAEINLAPAASGQTTVTWNVRGKNTFIGRVVCAFMSMDKMVGVPFENGLAELKRITEAEAGAKR